MIDRLIHILNHEPDFEVQKRELTRWLSEPNDAVACDPVPILGILTEFAASHSAKSDSIDWASLISPVVAWLVQSDRQPTATDNSQIPQLVDSLYRMSPEQSSLRSYLLALLATDGSDEAIELWTSLLCTDPPHHRGTIQWAFSPMLKANASFTQPQFDQLFTQATGHLPVAASVLDLANFAFREGLIEPHPGLTRAVPLTELLGQLVAQMSRIEEGQLPATATAESVSQMVGDAVALIVALCDALALMQHTPAIGKLHQAMGLKHRRLQTEAAAALARLGDETGRDVLIGLAEHPSVRLRVLAYARELGIEDKISLEFQGEIAIAESHLATWLAEPAQMGVAPTQMQLIDSRELHWPGYEHPLLCFLFQYSYQAGQSTFSNIGISGPLTHAFAADITDLALSDQYAAFAGWQTMHAEIFVLPMDRAQSAMAGVLERLTRKLESLTDSFRDLQSVATAGFFGEYQLIATGYGPTTDQSDEVPTTIIVSDESVDPFPPGNPLAPMDWQLALDIWRGRRLLANFNPVEQYE